MRRRAHLLVATATLVTALVPVVASTTPTGALADRTQGIRNALIGAGAHFYGLADILTGAVPRHNSLPL